MPLDRQVKVARNDPVTCTSRYSLIAHVPFKTAQAVSDTMIAPPRSPASRVRTLSTDRGKQLAQYERIAAALDADVCLIVMTAAAAPAS